MQIWKYSFDKTNMLNPEPSARSAVPGVNPEREY